MAMKNTVVWLCVVVVTLLTFPVVGRGQDVPGVSIGAFMEQRTEASIDGEDLSFDYYGARFKARDARFVEGFVDLGMQAMSLKGYSVDDTGSFGLGGTLWLTRAEDGFLGFDLGVYGSYHVADYTIESDASQGATDAKYTRYMLQGVARAYVSGSIHPFLRAGVTGTELEPDGDGVLPADGVKITNSAVNVGSEFLLSEQCVLTIEGNYSEGVGGGIHLDYYF